MTWSNGWSVSGGRRSGVGIPLTWLFVGDSLTAGSGGVTPWPSKFQSRIPSPNVATNIAAGGQTAAQILSGQWAVRPTSPPISRVFVLGGINSIIADVTGAAAFASLSSIYSQARILGIEVVAIITPPFGNNVAWTAGRQTQLDALRTAIIASTDTNFVVDLYTLMGDGGDPTKMAAIYDSGDGVHPNEAGTTFMANTIASALGL